MSKKEKIEVKKSVIVTGTKGGIGKSIISAVLALRMKDYMPTILIDGDIASPNLPQILKVNEQLEEIGYEKRNVIHVEDNLDFFSMGLVADEDSVINMRAMQYAQLITEILQHSKFNVNRKNACLIIDTPAGADEIHRTLFETLVESLVGAVVVTIPSAIQDCKRAVNFCRKFGVPVIAIVENMAYFQCECGKKYYIFGEPSADKIAEQVGAKYYQVPLSIEIKECIDIGLISIPEELEWVAESICEDILNREPATESILARLKKRVKSISRQVLAKALVDAITRVNKEVDLKSWVEKGYGQSTVQVILQQDGKDVANICLMLDRKDAKIKLARYVSNPDITIVTDLDVVARIAKEIEERPDDMVKIAKDAVLSGDVIVVGSAAMTKSLEFVEHVLPVIAKELYEKLKPIIKYVF